MQCGRLIVEEVYQSNCINFSERKGCLPKRMKWQKRLKVCPKLNFPEDKEGGAYVKD
jgi:hypothetical protein